MCAQRYYVLPKKNSVGYIWGLKGSCGCAETTLNREQGKPRWEGKMKSEQRFEQFLQRPHAGTYLVSWRIAKRSLELEDSAQGGAVGHEVRKVERSMLLDIYQVCWSPQLLWFVWDTHNGSPQPGTASSVFEKSRCIMKPEDIWKANEQ